MGKRIEMDEDDWELEHQAQILMEDYQAKIEAIMEVCPDDEDAIDALKDIMHQKINDLHAKFNLKKMLTKL